MGSFGKRLYELRVNTENADGTGCLSQEDFGKVVGLSRNSIYNYENDIRMPRIDDVLTISKTFNVSLDWLLKGAECKSADNEEIRKRLGLSDMAIQSLEKINSYEIGNNRDDTKENKMRDTVNRLLENEEEYSIIAALCQYFYTDRQKVRVGSLVMPHIYGVHMDLPSSQFRTNWFDVTMEKMIMDNIRLIKDGKKPNKLQFIEYSPDEEQEGAEDGEHQAD